MNNWQCLQLTNLPVLILWVHSYVSILCRNLHQKVQPESVFLIILRRDPETSSHTRQETGSESVVLGHVLAEMQPSPVSKTGMDEGTVENMNFSKDKRNTWDRQVGGHQYTNFRLEPCDLHDLCSSWGVRTLIQSPASTITGSDSGSHPTHPSSQWVSITFPWALQFIMKEVMGRLSRMTLIKVSGTVIQGFLSVRLWGVFLCFLVNYICIISSKL